MKKLALIAIVVLFVLVSFIVNSFSDFYVITVPKEVIPKNYAPVPKTGQTDCYYSDGTSNGCTCGDTDCPSEQDGGLEKGVAWPNPRFTDNLNGTVTDNLTGLVWLKDANSAGQTDWVFAINYCNNLADDGSSLTDDSSAGDWHLPNVDELNSLIDHGNCSLALPTGHPFTSVQQYPPYWTSTTYTTHTVNAYTISMNNGEVGGHGKDIDYLCVVWPVRDAK